MNISPNSPNQPHVRSSDTGALSSDMVLKSGSLSSKAVIGHRSSDFGHRITPSVIGPRIMSSAIGSMILLTSLLFLAPTAQAAETPIKERIISIDLQNQNFTQAIEAIADQAGISIKLRGEKPQGNRDLSFKKLSVENAIAQVLRQYGVQNHVAAIDTKKQQLMLAVLETSKYIEPSITEQESADNKQKLNIQPLTAKQIAQLVPEDPANKLPLSKEQISQLQPEPEHEPLTQEQIDQLIPEEEHEPLTQEQIDQLIPEEEHEPLTQEQIDKLIPEKLTE